jgi:hypothetical protein
MESSAWTLITKDSVNETSFTFTIPKSCPSEEAILCNNIQEDNQAQMMETNP